MNYDADLNYLIIRTTQKSSNYKKVELRKKAELPQTPRTMR